MVPGIPFAVGATDMEALLQQKETAFLRSHGVWIGRESNVSIEHVVREFLDYKGCLSRHTVQQYRSILGNFCTFFGGERNLSSLGPTDVEQFLAAHKKARAKPATLAADLRVLRVLGSWCRKQGYTLQSMCEGVAPVPVPRKRVRYVPEEKIIPFLDACSPGFRPIATTAILCGLRRKEIVNLKWSDVDLEEKLLSVVSAKTGDVRQIPLHELVSSELSKLEKISEYVFPVTQSSGPKARPVRRGEKRSELTTFFNRSTKAAAKAIDLDPRKIDFHGLRKTFAMLVQTQGRDLWLTGALMGHRPGSGGAITDLYLFQNRTRERKAIDDILLKPTGTDSATGSSDLRVVSGGQP